MARAPTNRAWPNEAGTPATVFEALAVISVESTVRLGWAFTRVLTRKIFGSRRGLARFLEQYRGDGIVPLAPGDPAVLAGASRCVACGRCDTEALRLGAFGALGPRGPMAFVLGVSRHSGEHDAAEIAPTSSPGLLDALTAVCPVEVPFEALTELVRRRRLALVAARGEE